MKSIPNIQGSNFFYFKKISINNFYFLFRNGNYDCTIYKCTICVLTYLILVTPVHKSTKEKNKSVVIFLFYLYFVSGQPLCEKS